MIIFLASIAFMLAFIITFWVQRRTFKKAKRVALEFDEVAVSMVPTLQAQYIRQYGRPSTELTNAFPRTQVKGVN
jgi:hypothetical protein